MTCFCFRHRVACIILFCLSPIGSVRAAVPVAEQTVFALQAIVVAGHPQAAKIGLATLQAGGNAIDAAVAVSLALGVAEPYASGLGGKLMLLYYEASTRKTYVIDAMDQASSSPRVIDYAAFSREKREFGYATVCVPGLAAGLWEAHHRWAKLPWAADVVPAAALAEDGFTVLSKTRDQFQDRERVLKSDPELARLYLPHDKLPDEGSTLVNPDLARTLKLLAQEGADGFYRGAIAQAIVTAVEHGGGFVSAEDFADYRVRVTLPLRGQFRGFEVVTAPPPAGGGVFLLATLAALETTKWSSGPLRSAANLDRWGRVVQQAYPLVNMAVGDSTDSPGRVEALLGSESIIELRTRAAAAKEPAHPYGFKKAVSVVRKSDKAADAMLENEYLLAEVETKTASIDDVLAKEQGATTHFVIVDRDHNIVTATQSLSLHFGAGVVVPGTGIVLNNSMTSFARRGRGPNSLGRGRRPGRTVAPTILFRDGKPAVALGVPGAARIPTAMLQVVVDYGVFKRSLEEAIGDTRIHLRNAYLPNDPANIFEMESSFNTTQIEPLAKLGWAVDRIEQVGRGIHFGGVNSVQFNPDGSLKGVADVRRTNFAGGD